MNPDHKSNSGSDNTITDDSNCDDGATDSQLPKILIDNSVVKGEDAQRLGHSYRLKVAMIKAPSATNCATNVTKQ